MPHDLSAHTLEAVRRNMTVMSFMVLVYYLADGQPIKNANGSIVIKLPLTNIQFNDPAWLVYVLWAMMIWWGYRYFALDALGELKKGRNLDKVSVIMKNNEAKRQIVATLNNQSNKNLKYVLTPTFNKEKECYVIGIRAENGILMADLPLDGTDIKQRDVELIVITRASTITFFLPILITSAALFWSITHYFTN